MILRSIIILLCSCVTIYSYESNSFIVTMNDIVDDDEHLKKDYSNFKSNDHHANDETLSVDQKYQPTWQSLDNRPIPQWYEDAKVGIFIHWGVFSVPSYGSEWFWWNWKGVNNSQYRTFMEKYYPPNFSYQDFAPEFTAQFFNATQWSKLFKDAGAKYVVLTSKHHEGFTLWPSRYTFSWTSADTGPHRDLVGELAEAVRRNTDMKFGLYHSLYEWFNPLYLNDKKNKYKTDEFVRNKIYPELLELVNLYHPEVIWSDGDWDATDTYWKSKEFLAWLYNESPVRNTVVVNDRWGSNIPCHHGGFFTCTDRYNPGVLQPHKWENAMTIDKYSWGFRRNAALNDYLTTRELVHQLIGTVSCGGNILINIGPTKDGIISPIFEDRLRGLGSWLAVNGESIYGSRPWAVQNDTLTKDVWYTQSSDKSKVYANFLDWPYDSILRLGAIYIPDDVRITLLSTSQTLKWQQGNQIVTIQLPPGANQGEPAWTLRFQKNH